jgi:nitroreductase
MALYEALNIQRTDKAARADQWQENFEFFGAPVGLIFTMDRQMGPAQFMDLGIYLQTLMLLAQERGLNTCSQLSWSAWANTVRQALEIGADEAVIVGMALGYGDISKPVNQYDTERCELGEYASMRGF